MFAAMQCSTGSRLTRSIPGFNCAGFRVDSSSILPRRQNASPTLFNLRRNSFLCSDPLRLKGTATLQLQRPLLAHTPKTNPSNESHGTSSETAKGPPLLTILAGVLVFLVLCWIIGSVVIWLFGLLISVSPFK